MLWKKYRFSSTWQVCRIHPGLDKRFWNLGVLSPDSGASPIAWMNRPVRTRIPGGVGAGGEKSPVARLWIRSY